MDMFAQTSVMYGMNPPRYGKKYIKLYEFIELPNEIMLNNMM